MVNVKNTALPVETMYSALMIEETGSILPIYQITRCHILNKRFAHKRFP
jgi:hypothetical protein